MRLGDKFHLPALIRAGAGLLFIALIPVFLLAGAAVSPVSAAEAGLSASSGVHGEATLAETLLPLRSAAPRAPDRSTPCFDHHHPCGPGVAAAPPAHGEPLFIDLTQRASFVVPRVRKRVSVPDIAPHLPVSLSILFQNFRE